ncbi:CBS domain-containing protein [Methanobrevibacter curvatus]|uniref:Inosine-5'-monophosphate dehydrogenase n=1 Tax=Methanobrevibacter curvatus TaxID=49547 RepID=A0A166B097_9EURY|nr:CBS domain-containing protein [Methanobrevibacter curvatus]KZX12699.1 inosine-5'-monophosphate dehydrogenase [Methanobrevibacter curvatus]
MLIEKVMNNKIISINLNTSPYEAFEKMYKNGVRRLFVFDDENNPKGVISYSDLIGILNNLSDHNYEQNQDKIEDIMSKEIVTVDSKEEVKNAANLMLRADVSGLLVLNNDEAVGVITKTDICRLVAANFLIPNKNMEI